MQTEELKTVVVEALEDLKADNICVLDVKDKTSVTDYMVIASGTSSRHVKSLAENLVSEVKDKGGR
ncbi:ribosome silencing factor, partial [Oleiphilus sp. HI0123]